jgi:hypothetical protein
MSIKEKITGLMNKEITIPIPTKIDFTSNNNRSTLPNNYLEENKCINCPFINQEKVKDRTSNIKSTLTYLVKNGELGSCLIFEDPETKKFIQLVNIDRELLCEIPLSGLTVKEEQRVKSFLTEYTQYGKKVNEASYQKWFRVDEIDKVTDLIEKIFINVFKLPISYTINQFIIS